MSECFQPKLETVEYRLVPGHPEYRVGTDGSLWSLYRFVPFEGWKLGDTWTELQGGLDKNGYRKAILCTNGKRRHTKFSTLVLEAFVGPAPPGMVCAHGSGVRHDNRLENLRWDTQKNNIADKRQHGTHQIGETHPTHILTEAEVLEIRRRRANGEKMRILAEEFGVAICTIDAVEKRRNWKHI